MKYGRRGKPKPMHVFMYEKTICWRDPKDLNLPNFKKSNERQIPMKEITEVVEGRTTDVFKRFPIKKANQ
jgi:hypothetical protein